MCSSWRRWWRRKRPSALKGEREAAAAYQTAQAFPASEVIGSSVNGQPIEARRYGRGSKNVVLVGGIHAGLAPNSVELAETAADWFAKNRDSIPASLAVWVVPNMNPDSDYAPGQLEGRYNARGVDLNRNWDCAWHPNPIIRGERRDGAGGKQAMSEPETQALAAFFERARPYAVLFWDAPATGGQIAPGGCLRINEEAEALAEAYGAATGYGYSRTNSQDIGSVEGDVTNWLDTKGVPAFFGAPARCVASGLGDEPGRDSESAADSCRRVNSEQ